MKNILILTPFYPPNIGGAETFTEGLVNESCKQNNVTVITFKSFNGKGEKFSSSFCPEGSLKVHRLSWLVRRLTVWKGVGFGNLLLVFPKMALFSLIHCTRNKYDVIHAQGLISGLIGLILKTIYGGKLMITMLALYDLKGFTKAVARFVLRRCDTIFVEGLGGANNVGNLCGKWGRIKRFQHWCDQNKFRPTNDRPLDKIRILFIGRPIAEKGIHYVQNAELVLNDPNLEFEYVDQVEFEKLPKVYQRNHILVVPSEYAEGITRVVVEGASCGCGVLTSDKGSLPEQVKDFGFASKNKNITENLKRMIDDHKHWGDKAYKYAKENYSNKNADVFLREYNYDN